MDEHSVLVKQEEQLILHTGKTHVKSVVLLAIWNTATAEYSLAASFALADPLREDAHSHHSKAPAASVTTWMTTDDNEITAKAVVGWWPSHLHVIAGVFLQEKVRICSVP